MAFACNIDRKGRTIRSVAGAVTLASGLVLLLMPILLSAPTDSAAAAAPESTDRATAFVVAGIAACIGGGFMLFEGLVGWCAVRAMGFKTPV
ncbi:MAG: hypothetical protein ACO3YY_00160 [Phycisphaerales bacterium]|jgi:hypothetical protein|nr:hypothetical protein [Planctomycetota bacterium]